MSRKFNYIVTDPCYLVSNDVWTEICDKTKTKSNDVFVEELTKHLPKGAMIQTTRIGDDLNSIYPVWEEECVNIVQSSFTSDSGFICIVPVEETKQYKDDIRFAIVESDDELEYGFDISTYNKTVVEFTHDGKEVVQSEYVD